MRDIGHLDGGVRSTHRRGYQSMHAIADSWAHYSPDIVVVVELAGTYSVSSEREE